MGRSLKNAIFCGTIGKNEEKNSDKLALLLDGRGNANRHHADENLLDNRACLPQVGFKPDCRQAQVAPAPKSPDVETKI